MADLSVTAASVAYTSGTIPQAGVAAETITAGQAIYYDGAGPGWRLAKSNVAGKKAPTAISITGASTNGYFLYVGNGTTYNTGATITKGIPYFLSGANAGGLAPAADIASGWDTVACIWATSTTNAVVQIVAPGITN